MLHLIQVLVLLNLWGSAVGCRKRWSMVSWRGTWGAQQVTASKRPFSEAARSALVPSPVSFGAKCFPQRVITMGYFWFLLLGLKHPKCLMCKPGHRLRSAKPFLSFPCLRKGCPESPERRCSKGWVGGQGRSRIHGTHIIKKILCRNVWCIPRRGPALHPTEQKCLFAALPAEACLLIYKMLTRHKNASGSDALGGSLRFGRAVFLKAVKGRNARRAPDRQTPGPVQEMLSGPAS